MAISDRINEMYTHIGDVYDTITNVDLPTNKNIQNIPSTMRSSYLEIMNNGIDKIWNNWEKVTGEGETLTLNSTEEAPMKINLKGNTSQETTTGKNLLAYPYYDTTKTINGITFTDNGDGTINANGTASANASFFLLGNAKNQEEIKGNYISGGASYNVKVRAVNLTSGTYTVLGSSEGSPTSLNKSTYSIGYIEIVIVNGTTVNNLTIKPMLTNNEDSDYEPYTNGASPNPDYPQTITNVTGTNTIKIVGKNLFDEQTAKTKGSYNANATLMTIQLQPNTQYTFSRIVNTTFARDNGYYLYFAKNEDTSTRIFDLMHSSMTDPITSGTETITTGASGIIKLISIYAYPERVQNYFNNVNVQIEESSTATTYEAYKGASYPISLGVENLFDIATNTNGKVLASDGTITDDVKFTISDYIKVLPNTKYTISWVYDSSQGSDTAMRVGYYQSDKTFISRPYNTTSPYTITTPNNCYYIRICYHIASHSQIQVELGDKANSYTPYGTTPIELCKIGDYQDSIKKSSGKNLFDKDSISNGFLDESGIVGGDKSAYRTSDFIPILPNIAYYKTTTSSPRTKYYDKNKQPLNTTTYWDIPIGGNAGTFTTPSNAYYFRFSYPVTGVNANSIMINKGTTAIPYEPYGKDWYLNKQIGKVVLDGTTNPLYGDGGSSTDYWEYSRTGMTGGIGIQASVLTTYFNQTTNSRVVILPNGGLYLRFPKNAGIDVSTNTLLNTWLSNHNTEVYYVLATPTYTEIEGTLKEQLEALNGAKSYTTQTNISQENNDKPFIISASALMSLKYLFGNLETRVAELETSEPSEL